MEAGRKNRPNFPTFMGIARGDQQGRHARKIPQDGGGNEQEFVVWSRFRQPV
jgi:hypothetical protein